MSATTLTKISTDGIRSEHYAPGSTYEPINIIHHYRLDFHLGNVIKYVLRYAWCVKAGKPAKIEDLKKAITYLQWEIEQNESRAD